MSTKPKDILSTKEKVGVSLAILTTIGGLALMDGNLKRVIHLGDKPAATAPQSAHSDRYP